MQYNIKVIIILCITLFIGIITYGWRNNWIIITYQPYHESQTVHTPAMTETITVSYIHPNQPHEYQESRTIVTTEDQTVRAQRVLEQWLAVLDESYTIEHPCRVQSVTTSPTGYTLYVSFDCLPFNSENAAYTKWRILETGLASLRHSGISAESVQFLVHHQIPDDCHIDMTCAWPITGFSDRCEFPTHPTSHTPPQRQPLTIVLDPAGDVERAGRTIAGSFERGITLQCCQYLQQRIQHLMPHVNVVLSRKAGEPREPLHNATFTNRVNADLCINIHAYHATHTQPHCYVYYYITHPETDFWHTAQNGLTLMPASQAHTQYIKQNYRLAHACGYYLQKTLESHMSVGPVVGLPYTPLRGIHTPAIALEMGLRTDTEWQAYMNQWTTSICNTIMHITKAS